MEIQKIKIEKISASPLNPRKTFDEVAIEELAANIEKQGLLLSDLHLRHHIWMKIPVRLLM